MVKKKIKVSAGLRTSAESKEGGLNEEWFHKNPNSWESKMENFPKYVKRQNLTRFLVLYEIFKQNKNAGGNNVCYPGPGPTNAQSDTAYCNCRGPSGKCPCRSKVDENGIRKHC